MFRPSENANELFRRLNSDHFEFQVGPDKVEKLPFGTTIEVQAKNAETTEVAVGSVQRYHWCEHNPTFLL